MILDDAPHVPVTARPEPAASRPPRVAYFSMEIALDPSIPTYSGGLGVLAGDTIRSAADLQVPLVGVTLLHRKGYFDQQIDAAGRQLEQPAEWNVDDDLEELPPRASITLEGRPVTIRAFEYAVRGADGFVVPVYLLDTDLPENDPRDRTLTDHLYGGDRRYRLAQEAVLGLGGVRMLRALGHRDIGRFHMNEGHASLLTVELLFEEARRAGRRAIASDDIEAVRRKCIFTTHTPVPAGHDQFPMPMVRQVLGVPEIAFDTDDVLCARVAGSVVRSPAGGASAEGTATDDGVLNMTYLALNLSHYVNGVAKKHAEVSRHMFAEYQIDAITNGVHVATWMAPAFRALFDRRLPGWAADSHNLRYALSIDREEIWAAHREAKRQLIDRVNRDGNVGLDHDRLTLGFARRAATYKRADLLFHDMDRLERIAATSGGLQIIYAGKAHPQDEGGKELIRRIVQARDALRGRIDVVYLPNYDWSLGRLITAGVDLWLNTPQPPLEASGTSGMKAAVNGVPSLSVLDGWWIEGCIEGVTGWAIGGGEAVEGDRTPQDAASLYDKLEHVIAPLYYGDREGYVDVMRHAIALNGSFFNTQRMVLQYVQKAYFG